MIHDHLENNTETLKFAKSLVKSVPKWIKYLVYSRNETVFYILPEYLLYLLTFLKNHVNTQFKVTSRYYCCRLSISLTAI